MIATASVCARLRAPCHIDDRRTDSGTTIANGARVDGRRDARRESACTESCCRARGNPTRAGSFSFDDTPSGNAAATASAAQGGRRWNLLRGPDGIGRKRLFSEFADSEWARREYLKISNSYEMLQG